MTLSLMIRYLTVDDAVSLNRAVIKEYGGSLGLRDTQALASAMARPQSGYYEDIIAEAAALIESIANNHPFLDGNKRTSFLCAESFLEMNGYKVEGDRAKLYEQIIELFETSNFKFKAIHAMLLQYVMPK